MPCSHYTRGGFKQDNFVMKPTNEDITSHLKLIVGLNYLVEVGACLYSSAKCRVIFIEGASSEACVLEAPARHAQDARQYRKEWEHRLRAPRADPLPLLFSGLCPRPLAGRAVFPHDGYTDRPTDRKLDIKPVFQVQALSY